FGPAVEEPAPLGRQLICALGRPWKVGAPLGADQALLLEAAQEPVEIADVHPPLEAELRETVQQLVAVQRALAEEQQERRLDGGLDPGPHMPVARADEVSAAGARMASVSHRGQYR